GKTVECQQLFSSLFQAHHYFGNEFFPLHNKLPISFSPFLTGLCVDDPVVIALHFLQSICRGVCRSRFLSLCTVQRCTLIPGQFFSTAALSPLFPSMITKHGRLSPR